MRPPTTSKTPAAAASYGQVIEYIQDRLYLASYTSPPDANTPFPYQNREEASPSKRSAKAQSGPKEKSATSKPPLYFTIDRSLLYNAFHADFGPLHVGHLYRFAVYLHEVLGDRKNDDRQVVLWSYADSRSRANAACILATYMVLIQSWPPHLALAPIAQMDPPCMPFRDAGYSQADYTLSIQDVVYGVWRAKEEGLIGLDNFSLEEYEKFERVDMGDFNWVTPDFLAFASPQHKPTHVIPPSSPMYSTLPTTIAEVQRSSLPTPFKNVLSHFSARNIGLVVRLNSELYSSSYFTALGIQHLNMIFDDGTCPNLSLVRQFINLAHEMITNKKGIAVHCKAGLGRTGCLIGAYLIYRYAFTANETIAYMRFMRPGMVVGPQQHWLHLNQAKFREWWFEDSRPKLPPSLPATPTKLSHKQRLVSNGQTYTPPNGSHKRSALGEIESNERNNVGVQEENLPAPTPGQPRKTSKLYGTVRQSPQRANENEPFDPPMSVRRPARVEGESDEEYTLRVMQVKHRAISRSPVAKDRQRRVHSTTSITATMTASYSSAYTVSGESDIENTAPTSNRPKTPREKAGKGEISIGKTRSSPARRSTDGKTGVRKTSGRVGSVGNPAMVRAKP
ncbi:phosphatases II [Sporormia fimetaria CBS 119925]|uniref:protein-tyrosine-phosphatase n=1 Tax=Sporormia fimetaria CBS 119925 TaxID=1340428 RepID=A0A6A6VH24_9PLEO|nr:phosphatases II [Sporormia fimetaria CBS 119925]